MNIQDEISKMAIKNYQSAPSWPNDDKWHERTRFLEKQIIEEWLSKIDFPQSTILNAGSGGTSYTTKGDIIHLDIIKSYIDNFSHYIVGSVENIDLPRESVDIVVCVGSVLNYSDVQKSISEFSRILKPGGFFIIEFERSNSAEFIGTKRHGSDIFCKQYTYNNQTHLLWMYSERHIRRILKNYHLAVLHCRRIHTISSLVNRFGVSDSKASRLSCLDRLFEFISYPLAHNALLFGNKISLKQNNCNDPCNDCQSRTDGRNPSI